MSFKNIDHASPASIGAVTVTGQQAEPFDMDRLEALFLEFTRVLTAVKVNVEAPEVVIHPQDINVKLPEVTAPKVEVNVAAPFVTMIIPSWYCLLPSSLFLIDIIVRFLK